MKTVGAGVNEIRMRDATGAFRVIYLATRPEAVYVLHCFTKTTNQTAQSDIKIAKNRLKTLNEEIAARRKETRHGKGKRRR